MNNNKNNVNLNTAPFLQGACTNLKPVVVYSNCLEDKNRILSDNKGKAAIYRWINKINGKTYVRSSVNLTIRFYKYYSLTQLNTSTKRKTAIYNALLKYGFKNFKLEILEYCAEGVDPVEREQYFLDLLKPEYNILQKAGSLLGFRHKAETLEFFKNERKTLLEKIYPKQLREEFCHQSIVKNYLGRKKVLNFQALHELKFLRLL